MSNQFGRRETPMEQFEAMLKASNHFADAMNTHRQAVAEVFADLIGLMVEGGALQASQVLGALHRLENEPGRPSVGSARRLMAVLVRDALAKKQGAR